MAAWTSPTVGPAAVVVVVAPGALITAISRAVAAAKKDAADAIAGEAGAFVQVGKVSASRGGEWQGLKTLTDQLAAETSVPIDPAAATSPPALRLPANFTDPVASARPDPRRPRRLSPSP